MTSSRKPGRPKDREWSHEPSEAERRYYRRFMRAIQYSLLAARLYWLMSRCGKPEPPYGRPGRCGKFFCPSCRHAFRAEWIDNATRWFGPIPDTHTYFGTVIFDARKHIIARRGSNLDRANEFWGLPTRPFEELPLDYGPLFKRLGKYRSGITKSLIRRTAKGKQLLLTDDLILEGAFEFEAKVFDRPDSDIGRFITDYRRAEGLSDPKPGDRFYCCHLHLLVAARKGGRFLDMDEIGKLLRARFPHRHAVLMERLYSVKGIPGKPGQKQTHDEAIAGCIGYTLKSFIKGANDMEVRELALVNERLKDQSRRLYRHTGAFKRPTKKAIKARVAAINPKPAYRPKPGTRLRDGTRAK